MQECSFKNIEEKAKRIRDFLLKHGDALPEEAIQRAITGENLDHWVTVCDDSGGIVSAVTWEHSDWYLCTMHYLATDPEHRGKGLGSKVTTTAVEQAKANPNCLVLAADITASNEPSKRIVKKLGFAETSRFCWAKGEKPADILHFIKYPPTGDTCK
jgi:RimJ/RimL family protein N-acetyltransferase